MDDDSDSPDPRPLGYQMCRDFMGNVWPAFREEEFQIKTQRGGLTNDLYVCSLPGNVQTTDRIPRSVLLRIYGHIAKECKTVVPNSVIFALMSEKQLGPKLLGMTHTARLEEYLQGKALHTEQLQNPTLSRMIAKKLAVFHSLDMPLRKKPTFLNDMMDEWMKKVSEILQKEHKKEDEQFMSKFRDDNLEEELQTLKEVLSGVESPVVFSHNDLQEGNIMYEDNLDKMVVIDWEYCSYNYRGYDFGNHFLEWTYNYNITSQPFFECNKENYPTREQQDVFFHAYLEASGSKITDDVLEAMHDEANTFALASHFFWGLWAILQNEMSSIKFGFLEYAESRFEGYFDMKRKAEMVQQEKLKE